MLNFSKYGKAEAPLRFFEEICRIPHGSGNTSEIADYLCNFARVRGLEYKKDNANNVIIKKPATAGMEERPAIIFQGHTDMVAEKKPDSTIDMENEGLSIYIDGDFLRADGTTLGGDDGVALAYALAVLDSDCIPHPDFEAVFTSDEEIGLIGAAALDGADIQGRLLVNIDSDAEGVFTVGCAGGLRMDAQLPVNRESYGNYAYSLTLSGLKGGHSGVEIDKGRLNAIIELNEAISLIDGARIVSFEGGNMDNAIPRFATCIFNTECEIEGADALFSHFLNERRAAEEDISLTLTPLEKREAVIDEISQERFTRTVASLSSGIISMSEDIKGLVETSKNLGIIKTENDKIKISYSLRSSSEEKKTLEKTRVRNAYTSIGASVSERGEYPAWEYRRESHLRQTMCRVYRDMYGKDAEVITIHAGLECGIFSKKLEGLDCVSIGPDNFDIHTTEERLSLSSFARVWDFLLEVLKEI